MHHGTCVTPVPWCMLGSLANSFLWRGKHSRPMHNPQFYVSGKRPMTWYLLGRFVTWDLNSKFVLIQFNHPKAMRQIFIIFVPGRCQNENLCWQCRKFHQNEDIHSRSGHCSVLHSSCSAEAEAPPSQSSGPSFAPPQSRDLVMTPPPQVTVQSLHGAQVCHSAVNENNGFI